jgi:alpha-glucosidase
LEPVAHADGVLAYRRRHRHSRFLIGLNFGSLLRRFRFEGNGKVALSTHLDREGESVAGAIELRADEGVIVALARE